MKASTVFDRAREKRVACFFEGTFLRDEWKGILFNCEENRGALSVFWSWICCMKKKKKRGSRVFFHPTSFSIPWSGLGFSISITTLISTNVQASTLWPKKKAKKKITSEKCLLPTNPAISLSGQIIMRYSREIPGLERADASYYFIISCCCVWVYNIGLQSFLMLYGLHPFWPISNLICVRMLLTLQFSFKE